MKINDIISSPWAILPERLESIQNIYNEYIKSPKIDISELKKFTAAEKGSGKEDRNYQVINNKAIIQIDGVLAKNPGFFEAWLFGLISMEQIESDFKTALMDRQVDSIILKIDSPGGTIGGLESLGDLIFSNRKIKPIIAISSGIMASAAYWAGSAAHEIYITGETVLVGSIGVASVHKDLSKAYEKLGVKFTDIYSGKYKRIASENKPLSKEGRLYLQDQLDIMYSIFVDTVARNRAESKGNVLKNMADGKIFIGTEAVSVGLVDGVLSFDSLISMGPEDMKPMKKKPIKEESKVEITLEVLEKDYPSIFGSVKNLGKADAEKEFSNKLKLEKESAKAEGVKSENERVSSILAFTKPGREAIIKECINDVTITAGDAAQKIVKVEDDALGKIKSDFNDDATPPVKGDNSQEARDKASAEAKAKANEKGKDFMATVKEYAIENKCSNGQAVKYISEKFPELHSEYIEKQTKG